METEKKRKKGEIAEVDSGSGRRKKEVVTPSPTEEEVEEFFAILRRMRVAVKYFENNNVNCDTHIKVTGNLLPAAAAAAVPAVAETVNVVKVGDNGVLDLNSVPDGESDID